MYFKVIATDIKDLLVFNLLNPVQVATELKQEMEHILSIQDVSEKRQLANAWTESKLCNSTLPLSESDQKALQAFRRFVFSEGRPEALEFNHPQWLLDQGANTHFERVDTQLQDLLKQITKLGELTETVMRHTYIPNRQAWQGNPTQAYYIERARGLAVDFSHSKLPEAKAIVLEMNAFLKAMGQATYQGSKACNLL